MIFTYTHTRSYRFRASWKKTFLATCCLLFCLVSFAQSPVNYVEYYIDQDPGINKATPVTVTSNAVITNASFNVPVTGLTNGIHMLGARARTVSGVWSMTHFWFVFKPYPVVSTAALSNVTKVEYYVDADPGFGKGTSVNITAGTDLANLSFTINPSSLTKGTHIIGVRALSANGMWSITNYWLFYNPFDNISPATTQSINYAEYFLNKDPGFGKGTALSLTASTDISNQSFNIALDTLKTGTNIVGIRAKTSGGLWSLTNYWLFVKPFGATPTPAAAGNVTEMEYYFDYDPGEGKANPVTITPGTDLANISLNADITNIIPGDHYVTIRAKDVNGNWSHVNNIKFNIAGTPPVLSTTYTGTKTLCTGSQVNIGYSITGAVFKNTNRFIAQLSDAYGSFATPVDIGTITSAVASGSFTATIPTTIATGSSYRIRVISTNQCIIGTNNGADLVVNRTTAPTVTTSGSTDICSGNTVTLTSSSAIAYQWFLNGTAINGATDRTYAAAADGSYTVVATANSCTSPASAATTVTKKQSPPVPQITASGSLSFCTGGSVTLGSSSVANNQWLLNGSVITNANTQAITITASGVYTVSVSATTGCTATSSGVTVTASAQPAKPVVTIKSNRPAAICPGAADTLISSASANNQWLKNGQAISGATSQNLVVTEAGDYRVRVTGNGGCADSSDMITISLLPAPAIPVISSATGKALLCTGGSLSLSSSDKTNSNQWLLNGAILPSATDTLLSVTSIGTYLLRVTSSAGCSATATPFTVTAATPPAKPVITARNGLSFCSGDTIRLNYGSQPGNQWYKNGELIPGATDTALVVVSAAAYTVSLKDANGCTSPVSDNMVATVKAKPVAPVVSAGGPLRFCEGSNVVLTSGVAAGNQWFRNGLAITGATAASYTATATGVYMVSRDSAGCASASTALSVTADAKPAVPVITVSGAATFCTGSQATLTSSASSGNQWYRNGTIITGAVATTYDAGASGVYEVRATNSAGCTSISAGVALTATVSPNLPVITATGALTFCDTGRVILNSGALSGNQWYKDNTIIAGATAGVFTATQSGAYSVKVTNNNCSTASAPVTVTANSIPPKPTITWNASNLVSSSASGNQWLSDLTNITGATAQTYKPSSNGYYRVVVENGGCRSAASDPFYYLVTAVVNLPAVSSGSYRILPNPVTEKLLISARNATGKTTVYLIDAMGKRCLSRVFTGTTTLEVKHLPTGTYTVLLTDEKTKQQESKQIIKL